MGMSRDMKIGFVFELDESLKTNESFRTVHNCSNTTCENHKKNLYDKKFCSECGSKVIEKKQSLGKKYPQCYEFCEEFLDGDEVVATDNGGLPENIWLYNYFIKAPELVPFCPSEEDVEESEFFLNISNLNIEEGIKRFKEIKEVKNFLTIFESVYGEGKIHVRYGFYSTVY